MNKKLHSSNLVFLINHLVLIEGRNKENVVHFICKENGAVDAVTLFEVTIFISLGMFH